MFVKVLLTVTMHSYTYNTTYAHLVQVGGAISRLQMKISMQLLIIPYFMQRSLAKYKNR